MRDGMSPGAPRLSSVDPLTGLADASKIIAGEESHIIIKRVIYRTMYVRVYSIQGPFTNI